MLDEQIIEQERSLHEEAKEWDITMHYMPAFLEAGGGSEAMMC